MKRTIVKIKNHIIEKYVVAQRGKNKNDLSCDEANAWLAKKITSGDPFVLTRMGYAELSFFAECDKRNLNNNNKKYKNFKMAEMFDNDAEQIIKYLNQLKKVYSESDIQVCWYKTLAEAKLLKKYGRPEVKCTDFVLLEPFFLDNPWTKALEGKKVLVVSPFSATIEKQYQRIQDIYPNEFMPKFELTTVQSVWYAPTPGKDDRFECWNDALEYLKNEVKKKDYDIALLSCGPFGVPLLDTIYGMGKQGIYVGGALQLYFGIRGNRWDQYPAYQPLFNDNWVWPGDDNRPKGAANYEKGCYW